MTAPATRTETDLDISDCPRCHGIGWRWSVIRAGGLSWHRHDNCPDCLGTGQRHTATSCGECGVSLLVPWSVDHTLAPLRCESCAAVVNNVETARHAGERSK